MAWEGALLPRSRFIKFFYLSQSWRNGGGYIFSSVVGFRSINPFIWLQENNKPKHTPRQIIICCFGQKKAPTEAGVLSIGRKRPKRRNQCIVDDCKRIYTTLCIDS